MYDTPLHARSSTRMVGLSTTAVVSAAAIWALVAGVGGQIAVPIQKVMEVALIQNAPQKPIETPKLDLPKDPQPTLDTPPPQLIVPKVDFQVDEPAIVATPAPTAPAPALAVAPAPGVPDATPRLITATKPPYPTTAIRDKEDGSTRLSLCVNETGRVTAAKLAASSGHPVLDDAALKWIDQAHFKPGVKDGRPTAMCDYAITYQWNLKDATR